MVDKLHILEVIHNALDGSDKFLVDLKVTTDNRIYVAIDGDNGVMIDDCVELSRTIENSLNREEEDFELNVASAGLDSPLRLPRQYKKNIGQELQVTLFDGTVVNGELIAATDEDITLRPQQHKKKPAEPVVVTYSDIKRATIVIHF